MTSWRQWAFRILKVIGMLAAIYVMLILFAELAVIVGRP